MARLARFAVAGIPQRIVQRGAGGQAVFREAADFDAYRRWLGDAAAAHRVALHAYALLPDRVLLLATPAGNDGVARMMQALGRHFVRFYNDKYRRTGPLWDGRYRSAMLEADRYLVEASRQIELEPLGAGIVEAPEQYRWSSCAHHVGFASDPLITDHALVWALGNTPFERQSTYRRLLEQGTDAALAQRLNAATLRGRALGSPEFLDTVGALERPAQIERPRGRPRRN